MEKLQNFMGRALSKAELEKIQADNSVLYHYAAQIFPDSLGLMNVIAKLELSPSSEDDAWTVEHLPFHTRDNAWLANYINQTIKQYNPKQKLDFENIQAFVDDDKIFDAQRCQYEQNLVRAQIQYMMYNPERNAIMSPQYDRYHIQTKPDFDKLFRDGVVDAMNNLGVSPRSTQLALERNAHIWRRQTMQKAFSNTFRTYNREYVQPEVESIHLEHRNLWVQMREYEYYQEHKAYIDELDLATKDMKLKPDEVAKLKQELDEYAAIHPYLPDAVVYPPKHQNATMVAREK